MRRVVAYGTAVMLAVALLALWSGMAGAQETAAPTTSAPSEAVTVQPFKVVEAAQPDYKTLYLNALQRIEELEQALADREKLIQEVLDLARGYRSDWEAERAIAEGRKEQVAQALELGKNLLQIIQEMKDTINKQHEIIMRLTAPKKLGIQVIGGAVVHPREPTNPGVLLALGWQF